MDATDRWYVKNNRSLYSTLRYNTQKFPLLQDFLPRDVLDVDFSDKNHISGQLGAGMEFEKFDFIAKAASYKPGKDNNDNAWVFGAESTILPLDGLKVELSGLAAVNYDDTALKTNPYAAGVNVDYKIHLTDNLILKPFVGFDFCYDSFSEESSWEVGGGTYLYFRGEDFLESHRFLDYDDVIPVGMSLAFNYSNLEQLNVLVSLFELADRDSLVPNLRGFVQFEGADLTGDDPALAFMVHLEYNIKKKVMPYIS